MRALLLLLPWLALLLPVPCAQGTVTLTPSQVNGPWRSVLLALDTLDVVLESYLEALYLRSVQCLQGCDTLRLKHYVRFSTQCGVIRSTLQRQPNGVYRDTGADPDLYDPIYISDTMLVFEMTRYFPIQDPLVLTAYAKGERGVLGEEDQNIYFQLVDERGIDRENIVNVAETDTCRVEDFAKESDDAPELSDV